jgi:hypothetical protein
VARDLVVAESEQSLDRRIRVDDLAVEVKQHHAGEGIGERRLEARQRLHLVALGLELGRVRHRAGQDHRQQLHRGELALAERAGVIAVEQQKADSLPGVEQRNSDDRANAALARKGRVDPLIVLGVEAEQRPSAAHGVAGQVVPERKTVRLGDFRRPADGPTDERVAVEQADRGRGATCQLTCPVSDALHDRLEVESHRGELMLHVDDRAQDRDVERRAAIAISPLRLVGLGHARVHRPPRPKV